MLFGGSGRATRLARTLGEGLAVPHDDGADALLARAVADRDRLREVLAGVRAQGYAVVDQELEVGLRSMAVPVRDRAREVVAAMNISAPLERGSVEEITAELLPPLREAAARLEEDLLAR